MQKVFTIFCKCLRRCEYLEGEGIGLPGQSLEIDVLHHLQHDPLFLAVQRQDVITIILDKQIKLYFLTEILEIQRCFKYLNLCYYQITFKVTFN